MTAMDTGLDLKVERIRRDVKVKDLAQQVGRHPAWVTRIEARRSVPAAQAQTYRDGLAALAASAASIPAAEVA